MHVAVQVIPSLTAFVTVLVIVAERLAFVFVASVGGGAGGLNVTLIAPPAVIVTFAEASFVLSCTETAMIVTDPLEGTVAGGVYVVDTPLPVCVGLNVPQELVGVHDQFTFEPLLTSAATWKVVPRVSERGGATLNSTASGDDDPEEDPKHEERRRAHATTLSKGTKGRRAFITGLLLLACPAPHACR